MSEEIQRRLIEIAAEQAEIDPAQLKAESTLDELNVPSITQIEIFFAIEEEFDIDLPDNPEDRTLGGLAALVTRLVQEKRGAAANE